MVTSHDMAELEQLAGRIVMIHQRRDRLRRRLRPAAPRASPTGAGCCWRPPTAPPPALSGAELVAQRGRPRTSTSSTPRGSSIADLLEQAAAQTQVLDVETHRAPIDEVIADIYERWHSETPSASGEPH